LNGPAYVVVDASVSLKWALDDEDCVEQAVALRDDAIRRQIRLLAPSLWLYEVTNGLVSATRRRRISVEQGRSALELLMSLGVGFADPEATDCYRAAVDLGVASYDAAYLALADDLGTVLWTGDKKFWEAVRSKTENVRWIGDFQQTTGFS
jgi:predicted nucleic acid-binding protein